jgi:hypothetical protein
LILGSVFLTLPMMAHAQEAAVSGTVMDSSGAVLPGVAVRAVHEATGNAFETVTDARGAYRLAVRVGTLRITAELQGFNTMARSVQLLVGQTGVVNLQMSPAGVAETLTVSAEAPLIETTTSTLGGNIDPRQMAELPVNGRNWINLALLAPGSRTAPVAGSREDSEKPLPDRNNNETREFQFHVDGQQVTSEFGTGGQPRYSQDAIAEFQFISNRFDATQGRSTNVQVNVITKSGTNLLSGLFRGNFRDSVFNSPNRAIGQVEPINNQQYSTAIGGPVLRDKLHYFANYEYEREPRTSIWRTPYPFFNASLTGTNNRKIGGVRLDYQLSSRTRVMAKVAGGRLWEPFGLPSATNHRRPPIPPRNTTTRFSDS